MNETDLGSWMRKLKPRCICDITLFCGFGFLHSTSIKAHTDARVHIYKNIVIAIYKF